MRKFILTLWAITDEDIDSIKRDLECEIHCCNNTFKIADFEEITDDNPCDNCQEFDCYGCKYKR